VVNRSTAGSRDSAAARTEFTVLAISCKRLNIGMVRLKVSIGCESSPPGRLRRRPAVLAQVGGAKPHRRDFPAARPAGERGSGVAGGVEPGGQGHAGDPTAPVFDPLCRMP
jgi:hypothetical protein